MKGWQWTGRSWIRLSSRALCWLDKHEKEVYQKRVEAMRLARKVKAEKRQSCQS